MHLHLKLPFVADLTALGAVVYAITFTPTDITAMMVAITALITALGVAVVNIMAARATLRKVAEATVKIDAVQAQGQLIEGHVNSAASASAATILSLQSEVRLLVKLLEGKDATTAGVLAEAVAARPRETDKTG